jgi:hypothetical protein
MGREIQAKPGLEPCLGRRPGQSDPAKAHGHRAPGARLCQGIDPASPDFAEVGGDSCADGAGQHFRPIRKRTGLPAGSGTATRHHSADRHSARVAGRPGDGPLRWKAGPMHRDCEDCISGWSRPRAAHGSPPVLASCSYNNDEHRGNRNRNSLHCGKCNWILCDRGIGGNLLLDSNKVMGHVILEE